MQKNVFLFVVTLFFTSIPLFAAERGWDFSTMPTNQPPTGCFNAVAGQGKPGNWKVVMDDFPLAMAPINPNAPKTAPKAVVAQLARDDYSDEHFPLLILGEGTYGDFTFKTQFKIADGLSEQAAGIAFRIQDEKNFYFVKANAAANKFSACGMLKGHATTLVSQDKAIKKGEWHELIVHCDGALMSAALDGEVILRWKEGQFAAGKIAFLTKTDTTACFTDPKVTYTPREPFAQLMVKDLMKEYPLLLGVKIFSPEPKATNEIRLIASNNEKEIGTPADKAEADVIGRGVNYYRRDKAAVYVTMPLRDRNGDAVGAVRFVMKTFPGQTEESALIRATPLLKKMERRVAAVDSLY